MGSGVNMTLTPDTSARDYVEPMVVKGTLATGASFGFAYTGAVACSGVAVSTCSVYTVGQTPGAILSGPVSMDAAFMLSQVTPPPTTGVPSLLPVSAS